MKNLPKADDKYASVVAHAKSLVEDWISRKYIPTASEFVPYIDRGIESMMPGIYVRQEYTKNISWCIVTKEMVQDFVHVCNRLGIVSVADMGCGHGVLAYALREKGLKCVGVNATRDDYHTIQRPWGSVLNIDGIKYMQDKRNIHQGIILSWPPYSGGPFGGNVAEAMKSGQFLFYCGEGGGGCTGDKKLHEALGTHYEWREENYVAPLAIFDFLKEDTARINKNFLQFDGIHDHWNIYIKK